MTDALGISELDAATASEHVNDAAAESEERDVAINLGGNSTLVDVYKYLDLGANTWMWLLRDKNRNPLFGTGMVIIFQRVDWYYAARSDARVTAECGREQKADGSFPCPKFNELQLVPSLFVPFNWKPGEAMTYYFNKHPNCDQPQSMRNTDASVPIGAAGPAIIVNDRKGTHGDNSGSFDVTLYLIK